MNVNNFIDTHGTSVTLKTLSEAAEDTTYGTMTESFSESTISAVLSFAEENDRLVRQGILNTGDMKAYVKPDQTIAEADKITFGGVDWLVVYVGVQPYKSTTAFQVVGLKKEL